MSTQEILVLLVIASVIASIGVIAYDRIRYRKHYQKKPPFIFLRTNNSDVRRRIKEAGILLCPCAREFCNNYLYTADGSIVCGFNENHRHLIYNAINSNMQLIDCGTDVDRFIQEVKNFDRVEE